MMPAATCPLSARDGPGIAITAIAIVPRVTITVAVLVMPPGSTKTSMINALSKIAVKNSLNGGRASMFDCRLRQASIRPTFKDQPAGPQHRATP